MKPYFFLADTQKIIHAYNTLCEPLLKQFDLPQVSFDILMFLNNNPMYSTAQDISKLRHIKKNLVSVHVEKLVSIGLLERQPFSGDRRKIALRCTQKAQPILDAGLEFQKKFFADLTNGISDEKWKVFEEIYDAIKANAEQMSKG